MAWSEPVEDVGPDAMVGRVLRQYWHPVAVAADLKPGVARPLRILGEEFTLYRGMAEPCTSLARAVPTVIPGCTQAAS
jgi:hypothetical protein